MGGPPYRTLAALPPMYALPSSTRAEGPLTNTVPAIDCDVHPAAPSMAALLPFLDEYWRNSVVERGIPSLETNSYPARAPLAARPQWRGKNGAPDASPGQLIGQVF